MSRPRYYQPTDAPTTFSKTTLSLLDLIARHDAGDGVLFEARPYNRWRFAGRTFNGATFYPLVNAQLIDVGHDTADDPVRITAAGRKYTAAHRSAA